MPLKTITRALPRGILLLSLLAFGRQAAADTITLYFSSTFSGDSPAGSPPWLTATFSDVSPGTVQLLVSANGLTGSESVDGLYFNLDPALNAASLLFTRNAASTGPTAANTTISLGTNAYRADGDGFYDIWFALPPPPGSQAARFTAGETLIYQISGSGLTAASFAMLSAPGPGMGPGPQYAAAHIQQIGSGSGSGWAAGAPAPVPAPAALGLLLAGLVPLARRRKAGLQPGLATEGSHPNSRCSVSGSTGFTR